MNPTFFVGFILKYQSMKTTLTSLILMIVQNSFGQINDTAIHKIVYSFSFIKDTNQKLNYISENMVLLVGKKTSQYFSQDKLDRDTQMLKEFNEKGTFDMRGKKQANLNQVYFSIENKKIYRLDNLFKNYFFEDAFPDFMWKITNQTKQLDNLNLIKATGYFKGRNYVAWFAPEIPISIGPWKLAGLPGLIVEAADDKNLFVFKMTSFMTLNLLGDKKIIALPDDAIKTTKKEFTTLKESFYNDPQGYFNATGLGTVTFNGSTNIKPKKPSNPIELSDN